MKAGPVADGTNIWYALIISDSKIVKIRRCSKST
jgi:hypothetical protein